MSRSESSRRKPARKQAARANRSVGRRTARGKSVRRASRLGLGRGPLSATPTRTRVLLWLLFALSLAAGIGLSMPLEQEISRWTQDDDLGLLENMAIQGNRRLSFAEIADTTGIERGTPLASIDAAVVAGRLTEEAWIREASVLRLPPSTLLIRVEEREPRAILLPSEATSGTPRLVDSEGHVFPANLDDDSLPRLVGGESLPSHQDHPVLLEALTLFERLRDPRFADLWGAGDRLSVHLPTGNNAEGWRLRGNVDVLLGQRDLATRMDRLAQLIARDEILGALGGERVLIDLRFADQAVLRRGRPDIASSKLES